MIRVCDIHFSHNLLLSNTFYKCSRRGEHFGSMHGKNVLRPWHGLGLGTGKIARLLRLIDQAFGLGRVK